MSKQSKRIQISLNVNDENLMDEFISQLKYEKTLAPTIVRLLSLYYYNEEVRTAVDMAEGYEGGAVQEEMLEADRRLEEMRQTLMITDYCASELARVVDDGISQVDMLKKSSSKAETVKQEVNEVKHQKLLGEDNPNERIAGLENQLSQLMSMMAAGQGMPMMMNPQYMVNPQVMGQMQDTSIIKEVEEQKEEEDGTSDLDDMLKDFI